MHALSRVHRSLRAGGVLLDIHPEPENSTLEIWQEGEIVRLGEIDQPQDKLDIEEARARLAMLEQRGMFAVDKREFFDLLGHYLAVEDWLDRWNEEGWSFAVEEEILDSARNLLATGGGELVIRETIRATSLRRLPGIERGSLPVEPA